LDGHKLTKINLLGNPIANSNKNYKSELFDLIPTLMAIDGTDKEGGEVESTVKLYLNGVVDSLGRKFLYRGMYPNE
jgi:hypothetical protein